MFKTKSFKISIIISVILGLLPYFIVLIANGFKSFYIPVEVMDDTLYYLTRVKEVLDGNIFIGNPYILENTGNVTTAFFVGDWFYTIWFWILSFIKLPLIYSSIFSQLFWTMLTTFLLFILYKKLKVSDKYLPLVTTISIITSLIFIWRPVSMSVVFPAFLFLLIAFIDWISNINGKRETILFSISAILSFYIYTYLWQIVLILMFLVLLRAIFLKRDIFQIVKTYLCIIFFSIPVFIYTYSQITAPFYFETLQRVGLINTHFIGVSAILYTFISLICLSLIFLVSKFKKDLEFKDFFVLVFVSLLCAGLSNILSGKDLELAVHVGRFTELFVVIFFVYFFFANYKDILAFPRKYFILSFLMSFVLIIYIISLLLINIKVINNGSKTKTNEEYKSMLSLLDSVSNKETVVFADDKLASFIPIFTDGYVLFHPNAELYLSSNKELEDRYLVSRIFSNPQTETFRTEYRKYAGVGNAVHRVKIHNRNIKFCLVIKKIISNKKCSDFKILEDFVGKNYFNELFDRFKYIEKNKEIFLDKYKVNFIVVDKNSQINLKSLQNLKTFKLKTEEGRFIIFERR